MGALFNNDGIFNMPSLDHHMAENAVLFVGFYNCFPRRAQAQKQLRKTSSFNIGFISKFLAGTITLIVPYQ